ncbi:uncharacterized protein EDB91DRAFT_1050669, partial [Suillus paluster]|uniref:uncharacterized protein n=1 Tax=Suillus paluster TaxID=48578 RepID=UPI001B87BA16
LIAEAIGAIQHGNTLMQRPGEEPLAKGMIPGIIMIGTSPSFYKITVTKKLSQCVERGD